MGLYRSVYGMVSMGWIGGGLVEPYVRWGGFVELYSLLWDGVAIAACMMMWALK
jgi:hypothetical protein